MNKELLENAYLCEKCLRFTDVHYLMDKMGDRIKSYCYKCHGELYLIRLDEMLEKLEKWQ